MTKTVDLKFVLIWKELLLLALIFTIFPITYNYFSNFRVLTSYNLQTILSTFTCFCQKLIHWLHACNNLLMN